MRHHDVFCKFKCWSGKADPAFLVDFLGVLTREEYLSFVNSGLSTKSEVSYGIQALKDKDIFTEYPQFDEGYFEWISVLETVVQAKGKFVMFELGAGFGVHLVRAAAAIRSYHGNNFPYKLLGIEVEPVNYMRMNEHFRNNNIDPARHQLIEAAVTDINGMVLFEMGCPDGYGSSRISSIRYVLYPARWLYRLMRRICKRVSGRPVLPEDYWMGNKGFGIGMKKVKSVNLITLLGNYGLVDLIHFDFRGEDDVIKSAIKIINEKVKKVHIGTHSPKSEIMLRKLLANMGWKCLYDYSGNGIRSTRYGMINFHDGVQVWVNPKLQ